MAGAPQLGPEFVPSSSGVPLLVGWRHRDTPDRGGCPRCADGRSGPGLQHLGSSTLLHSEVLRCRVCGGFRLVGERTSTRLSPEEARVVLDGGPGQLPELPDILDLAAEPARRGDDGRWTLPPDPEGLDAGIRGNHIWVAECLAALADVLHGGDPGATGRVYRARFVSRDPAHPHPFHREYGLLLDGELNADRLWDGIAYRPLFRHDRWPQADVVIPDWTHPGTVGWIGTGAVGSQAGGILATSDARALARWHDPALPSFGFSVSGRG